MTAWMMEHLMLTMFIIVMIIEFFWMRQMKETLPMTIRTTVFVIIIINIVGFLGIKGLAVLEFWSWNATGQRIFGSIFALPIIYYLLAKKFKWKMSEAFDILGFYLPIAIFFIRMCCFPEGCCVAKELPWLGGFRIPIREMEIILFAVFAIRYYPRIRQGKTSGEIYPLIMIWYGAFRFLVEWLREEYVTAIGILHWAHIWSLISLVVGLSIYMELENSKTRRKKRA